MTVDPQLAGSVREALLSAGFTAQGVLDRIGAEAFAALSRDLREPARRALATRADEVQAAERADGTTVDALIRLFLLDAPVRVATLPAELADGLCALGLVTESPADLQSAAATGAEPRCDEPPGEQRHLPASVLRALLDVRPYGEPDTDWYLVSDPGSPEHADHVLGLGGASLTLARITPRQPARRVLDLGCGAGVQTLHAARHADVIVATDTNPRALHLTELSARLSGIPSRALDLREGSLYEPVATERFDLIVSNPPFVISPGRRFTYRDAGLPGDALSRAVVRGAAKHLAPGGHAAMLANWLHCSDQRWQERVGDWLAGLPVAAWVVQREVQDVVAYAATWLRDSGTEECDLDSSLGAWLDEFAAHDAHAVGFGWVVLAAPATAADGLDDAPEPWRLFEDLSTSPRLPDGGEVRAFLEGCAQVDRLDAARLLGADLRLVDGVRITRGSLLVGAREISEPPRLSIPGSVGDDGWRPAEPVPEPLLTALVDQHTGPLGVRLDRAADEAGSDPLDVLPVALARLRELVRVGIVRT